MVLGVAESDTTEWLSFIHSLMGFKEGTVGVQST